MGVYKNGKKLGQPYFNGKKMNAYLNGKKVWEVKGYIPENGLRLVWNSPESYVRIGLRGNNGASATYGTAYNWDIYLDGVFVKNYTGVTSASNYISINTITSGPHVISMECKLKDKDYCARSLSWAASASYTQVDIKYLVELHGYGTAYSGTSPIPEYCFYRHLSQINGTPTMLKKVNINLPTLTLSKNCYRSMFAYNSSLENAPTFLATTLAENCFHSVLRGCTSLTEVRCHYPSNLSLTYARYWLDGITTTGKLYSPNAVITYGKPSTWTAEAL